jgi:hypothetical protein
MRSNDGKRRLKWQRRKEDRISVNDARSTLCGAEYFEERSRSCEAEFDVIVDIDINQIDVEVIVHHLDHVRIRNCSRRDDVR